MEAMLAWLSPILSAVIVAAATASINSSVKRHDQLADERHAETEAKRKAEAEWRSSVDALLSEQAKAIKSVADERADWFEWRNEIVTNMDRQDRKIMSMLKSQVTQMRSDVIHRTHRYLDDLGCASTEEKAAFWAEYEEYCDLCEQYGIDNELVDELAQRVMHLPERQI